MYSNVAEVRKAAHHYFSDEVASCAGMTLHQLIQFTAGNYHPDENQIHRLAIRFQLYPEKKPRELKR